MHYRSRPCKDCAYVQSSGNITYNLTVNLRLPATLASAMLAHPGGDAVAARTRDIARKLPSLPAPGLTAGGKTAPLPARCHKRFSDVPVRAQFGAQLVVIIKMKIPALDLQKAERLGPGHPRIRKARPAPTHVCRVVHARASLRTAVLIPRIARRSL